MDDRLRQEVFDTYGVYVKACRDNDVPALNMLIHRYPLACASAWTFTTWLGTYPVQPADLNPEGRHGRRRAPEVHIEAVAREGQGIYSLDIYRPAEVPEVAPQELNCATDQVPFAGMVGNSSPSAAYRDQRAVFRCGGLVDRAAALAAPGPTHRSAEESDRPRHLPSLRWHWSGTARPRHHHVARSRSVQPPDRGASHRRLGADGRSLTTGEGRIRVLEVAVRGLRARHRPNPRVSALPDQDRVDDGAAFIATAHHAAPRPSTSSLALALEGQGRCGGVVGASAGSSGRPPSARCCNGVMLAGSKRRSIEPLNAVLDRGVVAGRF